MKKYIIKAIIVIAVFFMSMTVISRVMNKGNTDMTVEMSKASYPVITMQYQGIEINTLHGYADAMEINYMREAITPLMEGRRVSCKISCYGREIEGIRYEVRSLDGERLVEDTAIPEFSEENDKITVNFGLKDLIDSGREYMLVMILTTSSGNEIRYYTRVLYGDNYYAAEKLDYVLDFSERTFDKERAKELTKYLESNSEGDNTTLGKVTIHSSFQQVTWGSLSVKKLAEPRITVRELASQTASILLDYMVYEGSGKNTIYYQVEEFYRIRYTSDRMYLLDYERTMNQVFDDSGKVFGNKKIYLGITGNEVPLTESSGGGVAAFVTGRRLYSYNIADNKLAYLFGFTDRDNQDERDSYDKHDIQILNVDEGGNVTFMVYGYMNRGRHEGKVGISVYYYDGAVNTIEEMLYVPSSKSPELLMAEVKELSYINKGGTLYLLLDNVLYGISSASRSCDVIVKDLKEGCYQVSDSNQMVVWQKENELYEGTELILMNLNTGVQSHIKAGNGEAIAPIGFIGDDLIYGAARKDDIVPDETGNLVFPMYSVRIENETEGILKEYHQEGIYVTSGSVNGNQINLKRVTRTEAGTYESVSDDQIINAETQTESSNYLETVAVDLYETVTQISLKEDINTDSMKHLTPREVLFEGGRNIVIAASQERGDRYYVYGKNGVEGIFMNEGNAVRLASDVSGVVVDDTGSYIWMKGNRSLKNQIMAIQGMAAEENQGSLAVCLDTILEYEGISRNTQYLLDRGEGVLQILKDNLEQSRVLDLTGVSLDSVLYYVNQDIPVLVMTEEGEAVLLIGFNEMNTVIMNPATGTVYKMGMNDSKDWFEKNGNRFITYVRMEQ